MEKPQPQRNESMKPEDSRRAAEEATRIPGTSSYRLPEGGGGPVGRQGIEAASIIGHDNLGVKTEVEKDVEKQGRHPLGNDSFGINPNKLD